MPLAIRQSDEIAPPDVADSGTTDLAGGRAGARAREGWQIELLVGKIKDNTNENSRPS